MSIKEQMEKSEDCKDLDKLLALAKERGTEISDAELDKVVGGIRQYAACPRVSAAEFPAFHHCTNMVSHMCIDFEIEEDVMTCYSAGYSIERKQGMERLRRARG